MQILSKMHLVIVPCSNYCSLLHLDIIVFRPLYVGMLKQDDQNASKNTRVLDDVNLNLNPVRNTIRAFVATYRLNDTYKAQSSY